MQREEESRKQREEGRPRKPKLAPGERLATAKERASIRAQGQQRIDRLRAEYEAACDACHAAGNLTARPEMCARTSPEDVADAAAFDALVRRIRARRAAAGIVDGPQIFLSFRDPSTDEDRELLARESATLSALIRAEYDPMDWANWTGPVIVCEDYPPVGDGGYA
jgi:hypothetical protein